MAVVVRIPTPLRKLTGNQNEVREEGGTIREVLKNLESHYPGIGERLADESGELRRFINIYVNEEDIRFRDGLDTKIQPGDEVSIIPAIAGGAK